MILKVIRITQKATKGRNFLMSKIKANNLSLSKCHKVKVIKTLSINPVNILESLVRMVQRVVDQAIGSGGELVS